jgi:hypothetical protein
VVAVDCGRDTNSPCKCESRNTGGIKGKNNKGIDLIVKEKKFIN